MINSPATMFILAAVNAVCTAINVFMGNYALAAFTALVCIMLTIVSAKDL